MSAVAIFVTDDLYVKSVRDSRGHLIHLLKCMEGYGAARKQRGRQRQGTSLQDLP